MRNSKSCQRLPFQEQHPLLSPWASAGWDSPPRHGRVILNCAVAVCVCETADCSGSAFVEREGLCRSDFIFFTISVIIAKYWGGKRDFGYGRAGDWELWILLPATLDSVSCFLHHTQEVLRCLFNIALEVLRTLSLSNILTLHESVFPKHSV